MIWGFGFNDSKSNPFIRKLDISLVPDEPGAPSRAGLGMKFKYWLWLQPLTQVTFSYVLWPLWQKRAGTLVARLEQADKSQLQHIRHSKEFFENCRVPPDHYLRNLVKINSLADKDNFQLIVVVFSGTPEYYQGLARDYCRSHGIPFFDFNQRFQTLVMEEDLLRKPWFEERFRIYQNGLKPGILENFPLLYLTVDGLHPNNPGNYIIASDLVDYLAHQQ